MRHLLLLAAVLTGGILLLVSRTGPRVPHVDFKRTVQTASMATPPAGERLRIAIAPILGPESSLEAYTALAEHLGTILGETASLKIGGSYAETNELLRNRQCDLAFVCTYPYAIGERDFGMRLVATPMINGSRSYHAAVVVRADSGIASLMDLAGGSFASADLQSHSSWVQPALMLLDAGANPSTFFSRHLVAGSHERTIHAVAYGVVDAAGVNSTVYQQVCARDPELARLTTVIARSEEFPLPPLVCHPQLPPGRFERLQQAVLSMHQTADGRAALARAGIDHFEILPSEAYDPIRSAAETWNTAITALGADHARPTAR